MLHFIEDLASMNLYNVCFCGGETLLRKELMCECIKILKPSGSHCTAVTNGLLANPATIQQLASAGLDGIQFSLDGLRDSHERLRNKVGIFPKVIDATTALRKAVILEKDLLFFLRPFLAFQEIGWIRKYEENHGRIWQNVPRPP